MAKDEPGRADLTQPGYQARAVRDPRHNRICLVVDSPEYARVLQIDMSIDQASQVAADLCRQVGLAAGYAAHQLGER